MKGYGYYFDLEDAYCKMGCPESWNVLAATFDDKYLIKSRRWVLEIQIHPEHNKKGYWYIRNTSIKGFIKREARRLRWVRGLPKEIKGSHFYNNRDPYNRLWREPDEIIRNSR